VRGEPTSDPSRSAGDALGAGDDGAVVVAPGAVAVTRLLRETGAIVVVVAGGSCGGDGVVSVADSWTCCTARLNVRRCWSPWINAVTPSVHATRNGLSTGNPPRGMERTTRSTSIGSAAKLRCALAIASDDVTGLCGRGGTDMGRLRKGEAAR
jgi:hypothetical protein